MKSLSITARWIVAVLAMTFLASSGFGSDVQLEVVADAFIDKEYPDKNYGSDTRLMTAYATTAGHEGLKYYLRFDVSVVGDGEVVDAKLELTRSVTGSGASVHNIRLQGLLDGDAGENWAEDALTWNNAPQNNPANGGGPDSLLEGVTTLASFWTTYDQVPVYEEEVLSTREASATDALVDFINADTDGQITLIVHALDFQKAQQIFASKEDGTHAAPTLFLLIERPRID